MLMWGINPTLTGKAYPLNAVRVQTMEFCFPVSLCTVNVSAINIPLCIIFFGCYMYMHCALSTYIGWI